MGFLQIPLKTANSERSQGILRLDRMVSNFHSSICKGSLSLDNPFEEGQTFYMETYVPKLF